MSSGALETNKTSWDWLLKRRFSIKHNLLANLFFAIVLLELFLLGSGKILSAGPLSLRMVLFGVCFIFAVYLLLHRTDIDRQVFNLVIVFVLTCSLSLFIGTLKGAQFKYLFEDVKPMAFFFSILFFSLMIDNTDRVKTVTRLLKISAVILGFGYFIVLALVFLKVIPFETLYSFLSEDQEFVFRGNQGFVYKGFLFLCTGCIFYYIDKSFWKKILSFILLIAVVLTFTRGFLAALVITFFLYIFFLKQRNFFGKILFIVLIVLIVTVAYPWYMDKLGDKSGSNSTRIVTTLQVVDRVTVDSVLVGHGFGKSVPIRPIHMEIAFLEIFHKQGVLGLFFWVLLLAYSWVNYRKASKNGYHQEALPFILSTLFVYLVSQTNPFMNNPIGMSFLLVSFASLRALARAGTKEGIEENVLPLADKTRAEA